jgi:hypothetical protein
MSSEKKVVYRTTRGAPIAGFRRVEKATTDAEATDQADPPSMPKEYGTSDRAKRRWAKILAYFASPIKASAASTPGVPHIRTVREAAFDNDPVDYRTRLEKIRNRGKN